MVEGLCNVQKKTSIWTDVGRPTKHSKDSGNIQHVRFIRIAKFPGVATEFSQIQFEYHLYLYYLICFRTPSMLSKIVSHLVCWSKFLVDQSKNCSWCQNTLGTVSLEAGSCCGVGGVESRLCSCPGVKTGVYDPCSARRSGCSWRELRSAVSAALPLFSSNSGYLPPSPFSNFFLLQRGFVFYFSF